LYVVHAPSTYGPVQMLHIPTSPGSSEDVGLAREDGLSLFHSLLHVSMNSLVLGTACSATLATALVVNLTAGLAMNCIALIVLSNDMMMSPGLPL